MKVNLQFQLTFLGSCSIILFGVFFWHDNWLVCLTESLRLFVLYAIIFRIHGQSCDHTTFPLSFDLFPGDKQ